MRRASRFTLSAAAVAAFGLTTACGAASAGEHNGAAPEAAGSSATSSASAVSSGGPGVTPLPTPTKAFASRKVTFVGDKLQLEVYSIRRSGSLVTLQFGLKNTTSKTLLASDTSGNNVAPFSHDGEDDVSGVYLVDTQHKKKYQPGFIGQNCMCSVGLSDYLFAPGQTAYLFATYAAPPSGVTTMDVSFPTYGTFGKVPVS